MTLMLGPVIRTDLEERQGAPQGDIQLVASLRPSIAPRFLAVAIGEARYGSGHIASTASALGTTTRFGIPASSRRLATSLVSECGTSNVKGGGHVPLSED